MEFSRQEYWSGLTFPSPEDLPDPGIKPMSFVSHVLAGSFFTTEPPGKPCVGVHISSQINIFFPLEKYPEVELLVFQVAQW